MNVRRALAVAAMLFAAGTAHAEPLARERVPEPLKPWVDWTLRGREAELCPFLDGRDERRCVWPARLSLEVDERGGRFTQEWTVDREGWIPLPGDERRWPQSVKVDGRPAAVAPQRGVPAVRVGPGRHVVAGSFAWTAIPELLPIPVETGLVSLAVGGQAVPFPNREAQGQIWLRRPSGAEPKETRLEVEVHRKVVDEIPLELWTRVELRVSGKDREALLAAALPEGFVPMSLEGPLPARLEPDGRLRVQVRPGRWTLELRARQAAPAESIALAEPSGAWDAQEVWVLEARPGLRQVEVEGVPAVDPQQTELPPDWKSLPAYAIEPGKAMRLVEKRRGDADPGPDQLTLERTWWLDFDGGGFTLHDRIQGQATRSWRLEMAPPTTLGRVAVGGVDQFLTKREGSEAVGVEVRDRTLSADADGRLERAGGALPAVGWAQDFQQVSGTLQLPPGWRLFYATGVDDTSESWVTDWTLLDLFLVLVVALAAGRIWGTAWGLLALVTLALIYREGGAPAGVWLVVLAAEALLLVLPEGRLRASVTAARLATLVFLVLVALQFMVEQMRIGVYPALEHPWQTVTAQPTGGTAVGRMDGMAMEMAPQAAPAELAETVESFRLEDRAADAAKSVVRPKAARPRTQAYDAYAQQRAVDPTALVSTGPGLPTWTWRAVSLGWRGPVEATQEVRFWLVGPEANLGLAVARVLLLALLVLRALGPLLPGGRFARPAAAAAALALAVAAGAPASAAAAEFPPQEMLDELSRRMLEKPECHPTCASTPRLTLRAAPGVLVLRMEIQAGADVAVPLPGAARIWTPASVYVDGEAAPALGRGADGTLWLLLSAGTRQVLLEGPLPDVDSLELPLPMVPRHVEATADGWTVDGVREDGVVEGNLRLVRVRADGAAGERLQPGELPPFLRVSRTLHLGLTWEAETVVERVTPAGSAVTVEVPLLPGESVTTPDVRVVDGKALASLAPSASSVGWRSVLAAAPSLALTAPKDVAWTEVWRVDASPLWHVETSGIPVVHTGEAGRKLREWRPWPGETVSLGVTRPAGVPGQTVTIDSTALRLEPGLRASDATVELVVRASRGGQHVLTLPAGAELQSVAIDGAERPIRAEGRSVTVPIVPARQTISLRWRESRGAERFYRAPEVGVGLPSVNAETTIAMPHDRWILFAGGGRLGPAVLFWSVLFVLLLASLALGRVHLTPLRSRHWFLLGIGLTQSPITSAALVAGWLLALGWRKAHGARLSAGRFDLVQVVLAFWTLAAMYALFAAIQQGLLGLPEMQIQGNGSSASLLRWYHDRSAATLPRPWVFSVPLFVYRLAMLAWALWLAAALLGWLRFAWSAYGEGGIWKPRERRKAPPAEPAAVPAP